MFLKSFIQITFSFFLIFFSLSVNGQSFNEDKTALVNYIKRMYRSAPFEGAKIIEDADNKYFIAAITISKDSNNNASVASLKASQAAKETFAEPCVKFEMLESVKNESNGSITYMFLCQPLTEFVKNTYKKLAFTGTKIIASPQVQYLISVIAIKQSSNSNSASNDRVAEIKAKQQTSALFNGSNISSDIIIYTDTKTGNSNSTEVIREKTSGFAAGLQLLDKFQDAENLVYIYFRELTT
jgi:hypothetical protein